MNGGQTAIRYDSRNVRCIAVGRGGEVSWAQERIVLITYGIDLDLKLSGVGGQSMRNRVGLLGAVQDAAHGGGHTGRSDHRRRHTGKLQFCEGSRERIRNEILLFSMAT